MTLLTSIALMFFAPILMMLLAQAATIALSEARKSGAKIPKPPSGPKRVGVKR